MHDREERTGSPVLHEFFANNPSEIMAARSAIYFRYDASRSAFLRHCRPAYSSIRQFRFSFRFSPLPSGRRSLTVLFFSRVFVSSRKVKEVWKYAALKVAAIYWRHPSDRQHTTSDDKIRPGAALQRSSGVTENRNGFSRRYPAHLVSEII